MTEYEKNILMLYAKTYIVFKDTPGFGITESDYKECISILKKDFKGNYKKYINFKEDIIQ